VSFVDDNENYEVDNNEENQPDAIDSASQTATHLAGRSAATAYGGAAGGRIYDALSNTELGKNIENKVAKGLSLKIKLILISVGIGFFFLFFIIFAFFIDDGTFGSSSSESLVYESSCNYENTMVTVMDYTNTEILATVSLEDYIIGCAVFEIGAANGAYSYISEDYVKAQFIASKTWLLSTKNYNSSDKTVTVRAATSDQQWCDLEKGCYTVDLGNGLIASYPGGYNGKSATSKLTDSDLEIARQYYSDTYGELFLPSSYNDIITSLNSSTATYYVSTTQNFWSSQASNGKKYDEILSLSGSNNVGTNSGLSPSSISSYYKDKSIYKLSTYCKSTSSSNDSSSNEDVSYPSGGLSIPSYYQEDYSDVYLSSDGVKTVASSGCGFTSTSMILSYLLDETITPREFVDSWSKQYYVYNVGMSFELPNAAAAHYGLGSVTQTTDSSVMLQALKDGHPVMSSQTPGLFTTGGHLIVLRGVTDDGKILVNDPLKSHAIDKGYNTREFTLNEVDSTNSMYFIWPKKST
jgi:hypothetical protein